MRQRPYSTSREAEAKRRNRQGLALIAATALGFAGLFYGAAKVDERNGISVSESLANNGIHGGAAIARALETERPANAVRLIGKCGGRYYAAVEESAFPAGCDWIEPIREYAANPPKLETLGTSESL